MLRLLLQEGLQHLSRFFFFFQDYVQAREIEISLVKVRCDANAGREFFFGFGVALFAHEEDAEIIERVGIIGAQAYRTLKIFGRDLELFLPCIEHAEVVVDFGIFRFELERALEELFA